VAAQATRRPGRFSASRAQITPAWSSIILVADAGATWDTFILERSGAECAVDGGQVLRLASPPRRTGLVAPIHAAIAGLNLLPPDSFKRPSVGDSIAPPQVVGFVKARVLVRLVVQNSLKRGLE